MPRPKPPWRSRSSCEGLSDPVLDQRRTGCTSRAHSARGRLGRHRSRGSQRGRAHQRSAARPGARRGRAGRRRLDRDPAPPGGSYAGPALPGEPSRRAAVDIFLDWFNGVWKRPPNQIEAERRKETPDQTGSPRSEASSPLRSTSSRTSSTAATSSSASSQPQTAPPSRSSSTRSSTTSATRRSSI